mgnify:CR=1 FL=1
MAIEGQNEHMQDLYGIARFEAFYGLMPHAKKGKLKKYTDVIRFPWDEKVKLLDKKGVQQLFDDISERNNKKVISTETVNLRTLYKN